MDIDMLGRTSRDEAGIIAQTLVMMTMLKFVFIRGTGVVLT